MLCTTRRQRGLGPFEKAMFGQDLVGQLVAPGSFRQLSIT